MKSRSFVCVVISFVLLTTSGQAGVIPGRWEKVEILVPGSEIIVTLKAGDRVESVFRSLSPDELTVTDPGGRERKIVRSEVHRIVRDKHHDSPADGTLIGAGAGSAGGLVLSLVCFAAIHQGACFVWTPLGAGVGAAAGVVADSLHKGEELLYRAS